MAAKTVENLLGVPIHYYAQIDFEAFVSFIDQIDGVKITSTERVQLNIVAITGILKQPDNEGDIITYLRVIRRGNFNLGKRYF